jgi:hypothetical protein
MASLAGRLYVPSVYPVDRDRARSFQLLEAAVAASGGRVVYSSFWDERVAPLFLGAEDGLGRRYGILAYPFTATRRITRSRPSDEHRAQIRFGDPVAARQQKNPIGRDLAGVDITIVLTVDPELEFFVGLDPLIYEDLPMGISVYYKDHHVESADEHGWAVWERKKRGGHRRDSWSGLETLVGFQPHRFLDYVRFEASATGLGLDPGLRSSLAEELLVPSGQTHRLEDLFGLPAASILDIVETNFRLGVAVRGGVAEHHLAAALGADPSIADVVTLDEDGRPDFEVELADGHRLLIECKTVSQNVYSNGDLKVETQKTRDSGAGRKYTFDQFDVIAVCLFPATGLWEFRFRWTRDLKPWAEDSRRMAAIQRVDRSWPSSIAELVGS